MSIRSDASSRLQVVLLGIGHTNAYIVKQWAVRPIPNCDLICITKFPTATYSGMLPGTLGRQFSDHEMRIDLEGLCRRASAKLLIADTSGLDLQSGQVHFSDHPSIRFDVLSIGVGSMPAGWEQHIGSPSMVAIKPMQNFLQRLDARLLAVQGIGKDRIRVAIVGGGVAGIEIAFCLQELFRKRKHQLDLAIHTGSSRVADGMNERSIAKIESLLSDRHIAVHPNHRVTAVGQSSITIEGQGEQSTDCVIWATGAAAPPVIDRLGLATDSRGFIATSYTLQSLSDPRIFAVGDSGTIMASPSPKAGVYAVRHCPILWHNIRAFIENQPLKEYHPQRDFLKLVNTGDGKALLQYKKLTIHARWCWHLKTWIDRKFIRDFQ